MRSIEEGGENSETTSPTKSTALRYPSWAGNFSVYVATGVINVVFPLFARNQLHIKESLIGLVLLIRAVAITSGFLVFGKYTFWHFNKKFLLSLQILLIGFCALMTFIQNTAVLFILIPFQGLLLSAYYSGSVFHGAVGSPERQKRMAIHEALLTAGVIAGSVFGGILFQNFGFSYAFLLTLGISFLVLIGQIIFLTGFYKNTDTVST